MEAKLATTAKPGRSNIRRLFDSFEIEGPRGPHVVLVFQAAQMSLRDMKLVFRPTGGFDEMFVKGAVEELLKALDFLHSEANMVHTGESAPNDSPVLLYSDVR
jgi:serine/threonine-protein kinase SRPK3